LFGRTLLYHTTHVLGQDEVSTEIGNQDNKHNYVRV